MMTPNCHILVAEQNHKERAALGRLLEEWGYPVTIAIDGNDALRKLQEQSFRLVIAGSPLPGCGSLEVMRQALSTHDAPAVVVLSGQACVDEAVAVMKAGALDFMIKPVDPEQLKQRVDGVMAADRGAGDADRRRSAERAIVTRDPSMQRMLTLAEQVADSRAVVLIQGESGTGKELLARFIHARSQRREGPFRAVNCGALPESLLESELFGYEKGAFTGALGRKTGIFEQAQGGTLLLDEITEMAFHLQSRLLRVLQEGEVDRVGGTRPVKLDVRVIATTNRDIKAAVAEGAFREDLFYRLNVIPLKIPPLRARKQDLPLLVRHFIEKYNALDGRSVKNLTDDALERLARLSFKGNVRELENLMERAVLLAGGETITADDLLLEDGPVSAEYPPPTHPAASEPLPGPLREAERRLILRALDHTDGNRTHAAKVLGISIRTLRNKLNEYQEKSS
ncbi:MAG: sigma-54 dependent transcriptional regulator [Desulfobacterales bacterium]